MTAWAEYQGRRDAASSAWRLGDNTGMPRLSILPAPETPATSDLAPPVRRGQVQPAERFLLECAPSAIDGLGVFAREAIPARSKIGELRGASISVQEARRRAKGRARIHIVEVSARRAIDASDSADLLRNINHSCAPNARLHVQQGRVEFYALRDIAAGEEISCDYIESHHAGHLRCRCGAPNCRGGL